MGVFNLIISLKANSKTGNQQWNHWKHWKCTHADGISPAIGCARDELAASLRFVGHISVNVKYINFARWTFEFDLPRKGWAKTMKIKFKFNSLVAYRFSFIFLCKWHICLLSNEQKKIILTSNSYDLTKWMWTMKRAYWSTRGKHKNIVFYKIEIQADGLSGIQSFSQCIWPNGKPHALNASHIQWNYPNLYVLRSHPFIYSKVG